MAWSSETLSTITSLATWETEILSLISNATNDYLATAVDIADATDPITTGVSSVDVENGKGVIEIVGKAKTELTIQNTKALTIKIYDSADDVTFAEIHSGSRCYYKAGSATITAGTTLFRWVVPSDAEDFIKALITSDATNSGTIDIYTEAKLTNYITNGKTQVGVDIELELQNRGLTSYIDFAGGEVPLDMINNASEFGMCSDFKCLELFYEDMSSGDETSPFYGKMELYSNRYKTAFRNAMKLADIDEDLSGSDIDYQANVESIGRNKR